MEKNVLTKQYLEENKESIETFTVKANLSEKDYTTIYNIYKLHGFIYIALPHLRGDAVKIVELTRDNIENTLMFVYRDGYNQTTNYTIFNIKPRDASTLYKKFIATKKNLEQENIEINQEIQQRALRRAQRNATESFQHPNEIPQTPLFPNRNRPTTETPMDTPTPEVTSTPAPTQPINTETYEIELTKEFKKKHSRDFTEYQVEYGEGQVYKIYKNAEHFYLRTAKQNEKGKIISESFKQIVSIKPGYPDLKKDPKLCKVDIQILDKSGKTISLAIEKCKITDIAPLYREVIEGSQNGIINLANSTTLQAAQDMLEILEIVNYNSIGVNNNKKIVDAVRIQRNIQEAKKNQANNQTANPVAVDTNIINNASQGDTTPPSHSQEEFKIENNQGKFLKVYKKDDHFYIETAEKNEAGTIISKILSQIISIKPELPDIKDPNLCKVIIEILDNNNQPYNYNFVNCKISSIAPLYRAVIEGSKKGIITLDEKNLQEAEEILKKYGYVPPTQADVLSNAQQTNGQVAEPDAVDKNLTSTSSQSDSTTPTQGLNSNEITMFHIEFNQYGETKFLKVYKKAEHFYISTLKTNEKGELILKDVRQIISIDIDQTDVEDIQLCNAEIQVRNKDGILSIINLYDCKIAEVEPLYQEIINNSNLDENLQDTEEKILEYDRNRANPKPTQADVDSSAQQKIDSDTTIIQQQKQPFNFDTLVADIKKSSEYGMFRNSVLQNASKPIGTPPTSTDTLNNTTTQQTAPTRDAEQPIEPAEITTEPTDEPAEIVAPDEKLAKAENISTNTPEPLTQSEIMEHYKDELEPAEQPKNFFVEPTAEPEEVKKFNFWKDFLKSPTENFLKCGGTALIIFGLFGVFTPFGAALACVAGLLCLCFSGDILKFAEKVIGGIANKIKGFFKHRKQLKDFDKFMEQAEEANPNTIFTKSQEKEMKKNPIERARLKQNKRRQKQLMKNTENDLVGATDGKLPNFYPIKGYKDKVGKHGSEMIELSTEKRKNNSDTIQGYLSQSDKIYGPSRSLGRRRVLAADLDKQQEDLKNASILKNPIRKDSTDTPAPTSHTDREHTL